MKRHKLRAAAVTALLLAAFSACSGSGVKDGTLAVGIMPDFDSIPFVVAKLQGYLPDYVELTVFVSPVDRDTAFYAGSLDGTISDILAACLAREGGLAVSIASKTDGSYGILTGRELDSPRDLEGRDVGMSLSTIIEYVTDRCVAGAGGDPAKVNKVSVPKIPSRLELLLSGKLDAAAVPEPYVTAGREWGAYVLATSAELGVNPGVMLFTDAALRDKGSAVEGLYEAYDRAVDYISEHDKAGFMPEVIAALGLPEQAAEAVLPAYTRREAPAAGEVEAAVAWLLERDMIEGGYTYAELVWTR